LHRKRDRFPPCREGVALQDRIPSGRIITYDMQAVGVNLPQGSQSRGWEIQGREEPAPVFLYAVARVPRHVTEVEGAVRQGADASTTSGEAMPQERQFFQGPAAVIWNSVTHVPCESRCFHELE
jgi:hypothetical protein